MGLAKNVGRKLPQSWRSKFYEWRSARRAAQLRRRLKLVSENKLANGLYYGLVNSELSREAQAVAAGQLRYIQDRNDGGLNYYLLRRNVHRLEKGLVMRPRRAVFGRDFIEETVTIFGQIARAETGGWSSELHWSNDVLSHYFEAVDRSEPRIERARALYELIGKDHVTLPDLGEAQVPFARDLSRPATVDYDAFMELCRRRRSVRWFEDRPVPRDVIDKALLAAVQAPSACNRQPFHFRIFDDPAQAQEIAALAMGTKGFADKLPHLAVLVGQLRAYPYERDRHAIYIDASLSAMSFMFALETMGAASCPINWPDHEPYETRMRERLDLAPDERVVMLLAFGWPDPQGLVPFSSKRGLDRVRSYNQ
jgi:nitroreductase